MSTSQTSILFKPTGDDKISRGTLGYVLARNRQQAYDQIVGELKKSGISQATLSRRLGKGQDEVSRLLRRPGNWTLNTFGALLFAISGGTLEFSISFPSDGAAIGRGHAILPSQHNVDQQGLSGARSKIAPGARSVIEANKTTANTAPQTAEVTSHQSIAA